MHLRDINPHLRFAAHIHYVARHSHVKATDCRLFYITGGEAALCTGGETYILRANSLFFCCAGSEYSIEAPDGLDLISLNFDMTQDHCTHELPFAPRAGGWDTMPVYFDPIEDSSLLSSRFFLADADIMASSIHRITEEFSSANPLFREFSSCFLKELLLSLHRFSPDKLPAKLRQVQTYIDTHYHTDISNRQLAAMAGYHEVYLNRIFQEHLGSTLHEYLLRVRLNQASSLILNSDLPLKAIPPQIGFRSYPHFSDCFRQRFGLSPAQYRKAHQNTL